MVRNTFQSPTVGQLASPLLPNTVGRDSLVRSAGCEQAPLSFAQQRLWFTAQLEGPSAVYNIPSALRLTGDLDYEALKRAINYSVARHKPLRTHFSEIDGVPIQVIQAEVRLDVPLEDISALHEGAKRSRLQEVIREETETIFDLSTGPLIRIRLLKLSEQEHVLFRTLHHIISDGWSLGVLDREFAALYEAFRAGRENPLCTLPLSYADFAVWQRNALTGEALSAQLNYWRDQLADLADLTLPLDFARPSPMTYRGASVRRTLSIDLTRQLQALSRRRRVTVFMTLLAALQLLLHRWTGQTDIAVGTPIANRNRTELEQLVGFFVNTLVLRTDLSGDPSFEQLLDRVRTICLAAYAHQDLPFERLVEELAPRRDLTRNPLVQIMLNMLNFPKAPASVAGLQIEPYDQDFEIQSKLDLTLYAEQGEQLSLVFVYNADLFARSRMVEFADQFELLLTQIVRRSDLTLSHYNLVTERARNFIVDPTAKLECGRSLSILGEFTRYAAAHPLKIAIEEPRGQWTYAEVDERSTAVADLLRKGDIAGKVVAIYARRNGDLIQSMLGVWKAGAAFLILDAAYPSARLARYIELARPAALIDASRDSFLPHAIKEAMLNLGAQVTIRIPEDLMGANTNRSADQLNIPPSAMAYVAFTSGTDGQPKAVTGGLGPLEHFLAWDVQRFALGESDRVSMLSGLGHDPLVRDIFMPLCCGATVCIPEETVAKGDGLAAWLERARISVMHLTPALGQSLMELADGCTIPALRYAFFGGEVLLVSCAEQFKKLAPNAVIVNFYGATETPQAMAWSVYSGGSRCPQEAVSLGAAIDDAQLLVVKNGGDLCGVYEIGEIYVRTAHLTLGYLADESLTTQRYITNPFTQRLDDRVFRTGDIGRISIDGSLEYVGRCDRQIKIRGYRVDLSEIEQSLRLAGARQAVAVRDGRLDERLVAYVVGAPHPNVLYERIRRVLPDYMIPSLILPLESVPLTPNNKIDFKSLSLPTTIEVSGVQLKRSLTPIEEIVAASWAEVLGLEEIGVHDNFFDLGGHSLTATQVASRLRKALHVDLPVRRLFECQTVASLAASVEAALRGNHRSASSVVPSTEKRTALPLSFAQEGLWFLDQSMPNSLPHMHIALRIRGPLDVDALDGSINEIVCRHDVLRTRFITHSGSPAQLILPELKIEVELLDISELAAQEKESRANQLIERQVTGRFDIVNGPLLRACLVTTRPDESILLVTMHHIVGDGWSTGVFLRELQELYTARVRGEPAALPTLDIQFADFALWQRRSLQGEALSEHLAYWRERLEGAAVIELPTDRARPGQPSFDGSVASMALSAELTTALKALSRRERVTLFMTLLTAFKVLLHRYTGEEDIVVGFPIAMRNRSEFENLIGYFVNILPLRIDLGGDPTVRELLAQVRDRCLEAYAHQDLPFEKLVAELEPDRDIRRNPLFQLIFDVQNVPSQRFMLPGLQVHSLERKKVITRFDQDWHVWDSEGQIQVVVRYSNELFEAMTVERMLRHWERLLEQMVHNCGAQISQLELLNEAERDELLMGCSQTEATRPEEWLPDMISAQALRDPGAVAVIDGDRHLSYGELDERSHRLAHYLHSIGAGPESVIAIFLPRSAEMIIAMLAVFKSGAAYLPLDPTYPPQRLAFMLEDSECPVVITDKERAGRLPFGSTLVILLDSVPDEVQGSPSGAVLVNRHVDQLAYVIYTSGSTGKPKAVMLSHRGLLNLVRWHQHTYGVSPMDRATQVSTSSFDACVWEIWPYLAAGASIHIVPDEIRSAPQEIPSWMAKHGITISFLVTPLLEVLLNEQWPADSALRVMLVGGDLLRINSARGLRFPVFNHYGPTENTVVATSGIVKQTSGAVLDVGVPIANTQVYVLDRRLDLAPLGAAGELYIAGAGVARGYLHRPSLTAERFLPDPFSPEPGARMYRTGDLACRRADGHFDFLGRADMQVKIRGYRIELGEIEAALASHCAVREAAVVAQDQASCKRLIAYVVPGSEVRAAELREYLAALLPDYLIPSAFILVDTLRLTPNGKLDRRALLAADTSACKATSENAPPRDALEETLVSIWEEILGVRPGIYDNFFAVGGDSITSIRIKARAQAQGVNFGIQDLFDHLTVAGLADCIRSGNAGISDDSEPEAFGLLSEEDRLHLEKGAALHD